MILNRFDRALDELHDDVAFDLIAGVAKGGMVWGAWLALRRGIPYATVLVDEPSRPERRRVEGDVRGRRVLLIDNLNVTGQTLRATADRVAAAGGQPVAAGLVIRHGHGPGPLRSTGSFKLLDLLEAAHRLGLIDESRFRHICRREGLSA
jgi:adenine/guanine phosphoribosyltransferase-like PRPP-binding protein